MTPEEYSQIRQEHIVKRLYHGNDNLAMEEKERILLNQQEPGTTHTFHSTTLDENGKNIGDGHVRTYQKVILLESELLFDMGLTDE